MVVVMKATAPVTLASSTVPVVAVMVAMAAAVVMGPPILTPSSWLGALYFIINSTSDQNHRLLCDQSTLNGHQRCLS